MKRAEVRQVVHDFISRQLDGNHDFADDVSLQALGLDKQDIEDLIFHLEDQFGLTAFTHEEDQLLKTASSANDLSRFLQQIARH
ncbi:phosphopantetheine-containing protein [Pseudomonas chlororaphis]|jgi:acyl carrier protein|uniref:Acyl carrier protein n=1 Tax=Pseudomonas morbosilactucae TaxID=2938197 RepID=A0A9X1Z171_9PSED|nr:acyl carrier protein [Pseudomonas morbosilactucae]MCK9802038.1 acyl carrier protein [Pseudomonas morbosilactucae]MCK9817331.1 acyl carrier protein [Pseudomonas morbosilactucae]ROL68217.1 phosphopantetheine-containing protein [Pseudomonas chlororaphis]WEK11232.1 MAG: acyl carrier protein [Pseudomonas sp.]